MRELEIRAWDTTHKKMIYINDLYWFEEEGIHDFNGQGHYGLYEFLLYIGCKDKNSKKIFDGDIVNIGGDICEIRWDVKFASFCLMKNGWMFDHFFREACEPEHCEVIGNVYENPELLKQESK